jgi:hypothetical protein
MLGQADRQYLEKVHKQLALGIVEFEMYCEMITHDLALLSEEVNLANALGMSPELLHRYVDYLDSFFAENNYRPEPIGYAGSARSFAEICDALEPRYRQLHAIYRKLAEAAAR